MRKSCDLTVRIDEATRDKFKEYCKNKNETMSERIIKYISRLVKNT